MKDLLNKRINSIQSLEERKIFRDIINHVFMDLADYQDRQVEALKKDFFEEMSKRDGRPVIHGTMIRKYEYDESDDFMFPMSMKDVEPYEISIKEINGAVKEHNTYMIGRTFLKCDNRTLQKLYDSGKRFSGKIQTDSGDAEISVRVCPYRSYRDMLGHLYNVFIKNGLEWVTPNLPYIHKFAAFMIDSPIDIPEEGIIESMVINLEEYEEHRVDDVLPVWNIEYVRMQSINFPIPTMDNVLKEHKFDVYDLSPYCYVPDFSDDYRGYVKRAEESVSVIIPEGEIKEWPMYKIHPIVSGKHYVYPFEIQSNAPADNFYNGYLNAGGRGVRTKGEISRILSSFQASGLFKIVDYEFIENGRKKIASDTYPVNDFIEDEFRAAFSNTKRLIIYYTYKYDDSYIAADIMSFIISELQQFIPDMTCLGIERKAVI